MKILLPMILAADNTAASFRVSFKIEVGFYEGWERVF